MHNQLKTYLEEHFDVEIPRRSECYYGEPMISFDVDVETFDSLKDIEPFEYANVKYNVIHEGKHVKETYKDGGKCIYFGFEYLDNDNFSSNITKDGSKKYGVISPDGKFYECRYSGHNELEFDLVQRRLISSDSNNVFESNGWLKLSGSSMTKTEFEFKFRTTKYDYDTKEDIVLGEYQLTKEQIETLKSYVKSQNRDDFVFNFEWYNIDVADKLIGVTDIQFYDMCYDMKLKSVDETLNLEDNE